MKALFVCGSLNQTKMMHQVAQHLPQFDANFTPYFCDGPGRLIQRTGALDFTVLGGRFHRQTIQYLSEHGVAFDHEGLNGPYDLVVTCSDLIVPRRIRGSKLVLVQEGMTDPENFIYHLVRKLRLPRWLAQTSTTGLSDAYEIFCVASEGYRDLFIRKGARPEKIRVTGIPNFDHCESYRQNEFPHRAAREIERHAPEAIYFAEGFTDHMIANCQALVTRYSSVVFVAAALGKEIHSDLADDELRRLLPWQNGGTSAARIANECLLLFDRANKASTHPISKRGGDSATKFSLRPGNVRRTAR